MQVREPTEEMCERQHGVVVEFNGVRVVYV